MSIDKRYERVASLVKLGKPKKGSGAYPVIVKGRPTYGSDKYHQKGGGNKAMVAFHSEVNGEFDVMMLFDRRGKSPEWRHVHPTLKRMLELMFWGLMK